jgi:hypothetical protein
MARWVIKCYGNDRRNIFEEEYCAWPAAVRADFRSVLNGLRDQPIEGWTRPAGFDRLLGKYRELGKLRFKVRNVQHRPLGFFGPAENEFSLLIWATERDGAFSPPDVRDTALQRRKAIIEGTKFVYEFDY